tara:strand:- start:943 stop:1194 length:252 start_codon:yes stop_codon:yes gene_type:complete
MKSLKLNEVHNLMMNLDNDGLKHWQAYSEIPLKAACFPYTLLPMYYFNPSKNDPNNTLKFIGLRTYYNRWTYTRLDSNYQEIE